jgi:hypothetical protein
VTTRDRIVILVLVAAAAIAGFWFLIFEPKRSEAAKLGAQVAAARQQLSTAESQIAAGESDRRNYPANYATVARLGEAVPTDDNQPSLVFQLDTAARRAGVDFRSVKLAQTAGATASPAPSSTGAGKGGAAPATQAATSTLPPGASVGPAGFPTMPFTLEFDGSFFKMSDFFRRLAAFVHGNDHLAVGGRLLTIDGLSLTAGREGFPKVKATVAANAFLLPDAQGATGGATPSTPASGAAPSHPTSSGSSTPAPATATSPAK